MNMYVNRDVFLFLSHVVRKNGWIDLPAQGSSMFPFIRHGDLCRFVPCEEAQLRAGDIVLYHSVSGQLVAHRLHLIRTDRKAPALFVCKGDTNLGPDQPIRYDQIIGKLQFVQKAKSARHTYWPASKDLYMTDAAALAWALLMLKIPAASRLLNLYLSRKKTSQRRSGVSL